MSLTLEVCVCVCFLMEVMVCGYGCSLLAPICTVTHPFFFLLKKTRISIVMLLGTSLFIFTVTVKPSPDL